MTTDALLQWCGEHLLSTWRRPPSSALSARGWRWSCGRSSPAQLEPVDRAELLLDL